MKRFALAGVVALALLALSQQRASADGWGISPGSFSVNLGLNVAWSGCSIGGPGLCNKGPACYGPPGYPAPAMYGAYGAPGYGGYGGYAGFDGHANHAPYPTQVPVYGY
jgi:hypothetical protein